MSDILNNCKRTRQVAADTFYIALDSLFQTKIPFSEVMLRDRWLEELRKHKDIFPDGWYIPPAHGIGVLIGDTTKSGRTNYQSLRTYEPQSIAIFDGSQDIYLYASPVDKKTGIIGDIGFTLYNGSNSAVRDHLKQCLEVNTKIANRIAVGMTYAEIYTYAMELAKQYNFINEITSTTDKTGVNIGHSVPDGFSSWNKEEQNIATNGNWKDILTIISKKRKFINATEQTKIEPGTAITLEPRFTVKNIPNIPMASYHTILQIGKNGKKELLTNFDTIFTLMRMGYMKE